MRVPRRTGGFTLLELLVSLTLFALLATVLHQSIGAASRAASASAHGAEQAEQRRALAAFLERYLAQALPVMQVTDGRPHLLFDGDEQRLVLVTLLPVLAGFTGPAEVILQTPPGAAGMLETGYRPLTADDPGRFGRGEYRMHSLGTEVADLRFGYYGARRPGETPGWHDRWQGQARLPQAVRVSLRAPGGEAWPEVVVMLRVDGNTVLRRRAARGGREAMQAAATPPPERFN